MPRFVPLLAERTSQFLLPVEMTVIFCFGIYDKKKNSKNSKVIQVQLRDYLGVHGDMECWEVEEEMVIGQFACGTQMIINVLEQKRHQHKSADWSGIRI